MPETDEETLGRLYVDYEKRKSEYLTSLGNIQS
jgi:hypothetical protein